MTTTTTANMMGSTYLEVATADGGVSMGRRVEGADVSWISGIGATSMSYAGLDASPFGAESPTTLNSPENSSIDHALFPSPVGDFSYLDTSFGDFSSGGAYAAIADVPAGQLPLHMGRRAAAAAALPGRYAITSAPNPTLYAPGGTGIWPTHTSPVPFLPTPPMADDLSDDSAREDEYDDNDDDDEQDDATVTSPDPPKRKRGAAAAASSSSSRSRKRSQAQLRTASRAPRKKPNTLPQRPSETVEDVKAREAHNQVEQQYRKRLNAHFERLLAVLPAKGSGVAGAGGRGVGEKRVSKAEVLDLATERIRALERQTARLERERRELRGRLAGCVV